MKFSINHIIKLLLSLMIGAALIWYLQKNLSEEDKTQIIHSIQHIKLNYVFIVVFLGFLACIIRAYRWKMLLKPLGYNPPILTLISSIFIMYVGNLIFPRLGEIMRCSILQKEEDIPMEKSIGTMIVERLVDMLGMGIIAILALLFEYDKFFNIYKDYQNAKGESNFMLPLVIIGLVIIGGIAMWTNRKLRIFLTEKIKGMLEGLKSILKLESPLKFILASLLIYFIYFITTYILYFAISGTEHLSISSALVVLTAGTLGIGITQGGIGAFQLLVTQALELYNIPTSIGLAYSWSSWLIQTINLVFFGLISWGYLMMRPNGKNN